MPVHAFAPRHGSGGDCRGAAFHPHRSGDDRADDRAGRRATSRLGAAAAGQCDRMTRGVRPGSSTDNMSPLSPRFVTYLPSHLKLFTSPMNEMRHDPILSNALIRTEPQAKFRKNSIVNQPFAILPLY